jgi:rhodanese-related sulfurtransferase
VIAVARRPRNIASFLFLAAVLILGWQALLKHAETSQFKVNEVTAPQAKALIDAGAIVIDVRDGAASQRDHLPGAVLFPLELLPARLAQLEYAKAKKVVVYCGNGSARGPKATSILNNAGFAHAVNLQSGIEGWRKAGLPTTTFPDTPVQGVRG